MTLRPISAHGLIAIATMLSFSPLAQAQQSSERLQLARGPDGGAQPTLLDAYADWDAYFGTSGGHKVCFAQSRPRSTESTRPDVPRAPSYMLISTRPAENVRNEASIIMGYRFKP